MNETDLIGRYLLKSHGSYDLSGGFTVTSGYINGELSYGHGGELSVLILFKEKPQNDLELLCYVGRYQIINEKTISHDITLCNHQSRNNTSELRDFKFTNGTLTLSAPLKDGGRFEAIWGKQ